jgi:serine phosphatase RsbU (regulator of sigma subunit)/CheY-like chemotaxis protein/anti-anti-sigma regulatory factor
LEPPREDAAAASILIVDDNEAICRLLIGALHDMAGRIEKAATVAEARGWLAAVDFDVVITDISLPDADGIELMQWAKQERPGASWMVLTGHASLDVAVRALQLGAFDFITKPLENIAALRHTVGNALSHRRLVGERDWLNEELRRGNRRLKEHIDKLEAALRLLSEQSEMIRADLRRAALIQQALLPRKPPRLEGLNVHALYRPSENVGGDLYDLVRIDDEHLVLIVADAAGHGLSAAMLAVLFRNRLSLVDPETGLPSRPGEALRAVNRSLCENLAAPGLFITAAYVLLDLETGVVQVASGGHPPLLLRRYDGSLERILHTGPALGLYEDAIFVEQELELSKGDRLLLHTDGLYECVDPGGTMPEEAVVRALRAADANGADLLRELFEGAGAVPEQEDDVTLVVLDATRGPSSVDNGTLVMAPAASSKTSGRAELLVGEEDRRTTLCIRGRGDWTQSGAFYERCVGAIDSTRPVMVDLTLCHHLDSTFLGTIHELAGRAERVDVEFRLQGVMPPVERLFLELGMETVMDHVVPAVLPLPRHMAPLIGGDEDPHTRAVRLLRAHESLATLSEDNLREFDPLLEMLRHEVTTLTP